MDERRLEILNRVVVQMHQAVSITDSDNRIIDVNPAFENLTGFSRNEVLGEKPSISQSGYHGPEFYRHMWQCLESHNHWEGEIWDRRKDGTVYPKYLVIDRFTDAAGNPENYLALFHDLSEQKATEEELERLHHYDPLTDLPNRILFRNRLEHEFEVANRHGSRTGILLINLDHFKQINDTFGFNAGDTLLVEVAERFKQLVRRTDVIAREENRRERDPDVVSRIGANDFAFILSDLRGPEDAEVVARRLTNAMEQPFHLHEEEVYLHASIGIAVYPDNADNSDTLLHCAETALKRAKEEGRGSYRYYSETMNENSAARVRLEAELRRAIEREEFALHYQPKLDLRTRHLPSMEALVRWPREDGSTVSPGDFIPLAEERGLIVPLGEWILRRACRDMLKLDEQGLPGYGVAVNLSARQFQHPDLVGMVQGVLAETAIAPERLELEITESMVMGDVDEALATMESLRGLGIRLAIDDFGTGYSSLSYLKNFPVNTLKVDGSFVGDLHHSPQNAAIVESVITLGGSLGLEVVAEGVEQEGHLNTLLAMGCDQAQGFHIARPAPLTSIRPFLAAGGEGGPSGS
jgi:PAS domain S-box-containing protein